MHAPVCERSGSCSFFSFSLFLGLARSAHAIQINLLFAFSPLFLYRSLLLSLVFLCLESFLCTPNSNCSAPPWDGVEHRVVESRKSESSKVERGSIFFFQGPVHFFLFFTR